MSECEKLMMDDGQQATAYADLEQSFRWANKVNMH